MKFAALILVGAAVFGATYLSPEIHGNHWTATALEVTHWAMRIAGGGLVGATAISWARWGNQQ